jgi:hypothetical protein
MGVCRHPVRSVLFVSLADEANLLRGALPGSTQESEEPLSVHWVTTEIDPEAWLRSYTYISNIALYRDSLLVLSIARYDPDNLAYRDPSYRADIYDVRTTEKLYEDIPLPGDLAGGGEHVRILTMDPARGWVLTDYALSDR